MSVAECLLPGAIEKFEEWIRKGYHIILVTGRPESLRSITDKQLQNAGIIYHKLIMSLPRGSRVIINDLKPGSDNPTAECVNLVRDKGISNVDI